MAYDVTGGKPAPVAKGWSARRVKDTVKGHQNPFKRPEKPKMASTEAAQSRLVKSPCVFCIKYIEVYQPIYLPIYLFSSATRFRMTNHNHVQHNSEELYGHNYAWLGLIKG